MTEYDNPFYHNHVFRDSDINRVKISRWEYPFLIFLTTYVAFSGEYVIKYKQWRNRYYIMGFEKLPDIGVLSV